MLSDKILCNQKQRRGEKSHYFVSSDFLSKERAVSASERPRNSQQDECFISDEVSGRRN